MSNLGLFRLEFNRIFVNLHKFLSPEDYERYCSLDNQRYGELHQDLYVFYLVKGVQALRFIASYLGRGKSSIERSNKILEDLGLIVLQHGKFNFITGKNDRNKLLAGADGLKNYRKNEQEKVKEKRSEYTEKYGNSIQKMVEKAVQKSGGTKIPTGKTNIYLDNIHDDGFSKFYLDLFQHFTPTEPDILPSPEECKRWPIYNALAKLHPKFKTPPTTWASRIKNGFKSLREGFQKRFSKGAYNAWMNVQTGDIEYTQKGILVRVKQCLGKVLRHEDDQFQYFSCWYRGEFDPTTMVQETLKVKKRLSLKKRVVPSSEYSIVDELDKMILNF